MDSSSRLITHMESSELVFRKGDERKALVVADVTFYLANPDTIAKSVLDALKKVLPVIGPHGRWYRTESMTQTRKATAKAVDDVKAWFGARYPDREEYGLTLLSGETPEDVGPWSLQFGVEPDLLDVEGAYFQCSIPAAVMEETPAKFLGLVTSLADALDFRSGHAGYGVVYDEGDMSPSREAQIRAWHNRFVALDARDLSLSGGAFRTGIKGPSWLTFLDTEFVTALGGAKKLQKALPAAATLVARKDGVMIQAGPRPVLGDRNRQEDVTVLRAINKVLRPIRVKQDVVIRPFGDVDGTREWLERFDRT
jgi:hypothetical protein